MPVAEGAVWSIFGVLAAVVMVAIAIAIAVTRAEFTQSTVPPTGPCAPFCTAPVTVTTLILPPPPAAPAR